MLGWLGKIQTWWHNRRSPEPTAVQPAPVSAPAPNRLERVVLTDGVCRTLFEDYADHRSSERGKEEIGWVLLGLKKEEEAIALAALPAGAQRDAGWGHIRFNSDAQALASRILRQNDKGLQIVGVVHTHPGSMRAPSDGDLEGDSRWVAQLRGGEGVFAIGTADARAKEDAAPHIQVRAGLCFSWYALGAGDDRYRLLPVQTTAGPDLAMALRPAWNTLESFAAPLDKLCRLFARVEFEVVEEGLLCVRIALAERHQQLRVLLNEGEARYYWDNHGAVTAIDPHEAILDRAVYLILAELAQEPAAAIATLT